MYKIKYLPLARKDLYDITNYIADHLKAPKAAMNLLVHLIYPYQKLTDHKAEVIKVILK